MRASELRPGMAINMDGQLYVIINFNHLTPGNLRAMVQLKLKGVKSGTTTEKRLRSTEEVDQVNLDRREIEYLYSDNTGHVFMDQATFEQTALQDELVGEIMKYLKPNTVVSGLVYETTVLTVEPPQTVDLKVADTIAVPKGATATNQQKEATMETGLKTRVPPFIEVGEVVRISTADGSYLSRA